MDLAVKLLGVVVLIGALTGCATTQGTGDAQLQVRVAELERTVSRQERTIEELKQKNSQPARVTSVSVEEPSSSVDDRGIIRVGVDPKEVQRVLKKAGYYSGNIDGKIGAQTIDAITQFQKDNSLKVDGIVGANTWAKMQSVARATPAAE